MRVKNKIKKITVQLLLIISFFLLLFIILYVYTPVIDQTILKIIQLYAQNNFNIYFDRIEGNLIGNIKIINLKIKTEQVQIEAETVYLKYLLPQLISGFYQFRFIEFDSPTLILYDRPLPYTKDSTNNVNTLKDTTTRIDLSFLPDLNIQNFQIKSGKILRESESDSLWINGIFLESSLKIENKNIDFKLTELQGLWLKKMLNFKHVAFNLRGDYNKLILSEFESSIDNGRLIAHGEVQLSPQLDFQFYVDSGEIALPLIKKFVPELPYNQGTINFTGDYTGNPEDFHGQIRLTASIDSLIVNQFTSNFRKYNRSILLDKLNLSSNIGFIKGFFLISPFEKNVVDLSFTNLDFKKLNLTDTRTVLNGTIHLNFEDWDLNRISGYGSAFLTEIVAGNSHIDTLALELSATAGEWQLKKPSRLVLQKTSQFFVSGFLNRDKQIDLNLTTDQNNLDTLSSRLDIGDIGGQGSLNVSIVGPIQNPDIEGYILLDSLTIDALTAFGVEGNFRVKGIANERIGFFNLEMYSGLVADMLVTDGTFVSRLIKDTLSIDSLSFYSEENYITLAGDINFLENSIDLNFSKFDLNYENYSIYAPDTIKCLFYNDTLEIEDFVLVATGEGEIEIRGLWDFSHRAELGIYFKKIQLEPFNQFFTLPYQFSGIAENSIEIFGPFDNLEIESLFNIQNLMVDKDTLGTIEAAFWINKNLINVQRFSFYHSEDSFFEIIGKVNGSLLGNKKDSTIFQEADSLEIDCMFKQIDLSDYPFFKNFNFPISGIFSGELNLSGDAIQPDGNCRIQLEDLKFQEYYFPQLSLNARLNSGRVVFDTAKVKFMSTEILAQGFWDLDLNFNSPFENISEKTFEFFIKIDEDTVDFINIFQPEIDILTGKIHFETIVKNTLKNLEISSGKIQIQNGMFYFSKIENPITHIQVDADIQQKKLIIEKATGRMITTNPKKNIFQKLASLLLSPFKKTSYTNDGSDNLALAGEIDLSIWDRPQYNLLLEGDQLYINYFLENIKMWLSTSDLKITGRDTIFIQGKVNISKAEIDLDLEESEKNLLLYPNIREVPPFLRYLFLINIPANFYIRSDATFNAFDMQLTGDINLIQEPKNLLEMYGTLQVLNGKYVQFEEFNIQNGRLEFKNPKELPQMDIQAQKRKYGYIFELTVTGPINNPEKNIRIIDAATLEDKTYLYPETKDQIAMLLFGVTFSELGRGTGSIMLEKGQEVVNQVLISQIEKEARRFTGLDHIRLESEDNLLDFSNRKLNRSSQNSSLALGKYLTPQLYLEYTTRLSSSGLPGVGGIPTPTLAWEAGNRIYLEYRINKNWTLSTYYEKQESDRIKFDLNWRYNF